MYCPAMWITLQREITHVRNVCFIHFNEKQGNDNEKNKEYQQGCNHVLVSHCNLVYELFEHGLVVSWLVG
jgi:hypothetical protein